MGMKLYFSAFCPLPAAFHKLVVPHSFYKFARQKAWYKDCLNKPKVNTHTMKQVMHKAVMAAVMATGIASCAQNAITGRNQLALYNEADIQSMAAQQYTQFLTQNKVVSTGSSRDAEMVRRVGTRLTNAINQYYTSKGLTKE